MPEKIILQVDSTGDRIDRFIASRTDRLSRQKIIELIKGSKILLNGAPTEPSKRIKTGDVISIEIPDPERIEIVPQEIPFNILYEDEDLIIIDKPANLVVHPACGHRDNTLVNALLFRVKNLSTLGGDIKPGIVHRLDKGTSGLMIVAKNDSIHYKLAKMFERHTIKKFYRLITFSVPRPLSATIETLYGRDPENRKRFTSKVKEGKKAITIYNTLETFGDRASYVEAQIVTGRTHQIRVHFSEMGCPIIGDDFYGNKRRIRVFEYEDVRERIESLTRPMLHSFRLEFTHPIKQRWMVIEADLPSDFLGVLNILRERYGKK
jgi:23S rRNA pseudouridine1911/1915/1917 synthase